ncbi:hypothetical protein EI94DRAFT_1712399 [Lactarius quietus]|nr:hypothetical protein EI94DRAFT_1712399 [Lactarius quietus]
MRGCHTSWALRLHLSVMAHAEPASFDGSFRGGVEAYENIPYPRNSVFLMKNGNLFHEADCDSRRREETEGRKLQKHLTFCKSFSKPERPWHRCLKFALIRILTSKTTAQVNR